jgi:hypothetical protein
MQDEAEMKEAYEADLRAQGAKAALKELHAFLIYCGGRDDFECELFGIHYAVSAIDRRLADLEPVTAEGGAA